MHLGSLAYLGMDRAVMQLPSAFPFKTLKGWLVGHAWRGLETFMQVGMGGGDSGQVPAWFSLGSGAAV